MLIGAKMVEYRCFERYSTIPDNSPSCDDPVAWLKPENENYFIVAHDTICGAQSWVWMQLWNLRQKFTSWDDKPYFYLPYKTISSRLITKLGGGETLELPNGTIYTIVVASRTTEEDPC